MEGHDMRKRYVYRDGEMVEVGADYKPEPRQSSWQVMPDIAPYKSMIDGSEITSRSKHRAHLRSHGCIEVGNETKYLLKDPKPLQPPPGLKQTIVDIANQKLRRT